MALEGNLSAFGVSEILQLIAVQQKTGMLTISNVDVSTVMFFRNGEIVSARDRRRKARDAFKDYLTRYGVLERDQLVRISQISAQSKLDFTDIVMSEGFIEPEELRKHWRQQVQETMHDVLTWEDGTYKFISNNDLVDGLKSLGSFNVEGMLMESMRRIDEFPLMLEMFPTEKLIFSRADAAADEEGMTENERCILALLEKPTALRDLIAKGKMPVFEVYEVLKLLREKDLILVEEPEPERGELDEQAAASAKKRRKLKNAKPLVAALLLFAGASYLGLGPAAADLSPRDLSVPTLLSGQEITRTRVEHRLRWLLDAHRAQYGAYPARLEELGSSGLATPDFLERVRANKIRYQLTGGKTAYTLL